MKFKIIYTFLLVLFTSCIHADNADLENVLDIIIKENIIGTDSGREVTEEFLTRCTEPENPSHFIIKCDDVLFNHYISLYAHRDKKSKVVLISEDGASVENRYIFQFEGKKYSDIKRNVWPVISDKEIGQLLAQDTDDRKYTEKYVRSVAHSSYRLKYTSSNKIEVLSGIPDKTYGTKLGEIKWDGKKFDFLPKGR